MIKINNKESYVPLKLMDNIIKDRNQMQIVVIEEEQSELCFDTLNGSGKIYFKNQEIFRIFFPLKNRKIMLKKNHKYSVPNHLSFNLIKNLFR